MGIGLSDDGNEMATLVRYEVDRYDEAQYSLQLFEYEYEYWQWPQDFLSNIPLGGKGSVAFKGQRIAFISGDQIQVFAKKGIRWYLFHSFEKPQGISVRELVLSSSGDTLYV